MLSKQRRGPYSSFFFRMGTTGLKSILGFVEAGSGLTIVLPTINGRAAAGVDEEEPCGLSDMVGIGGQGDAGR
jgi:hypothetical protein